MKQCQVGGFATKEDAIYAKEEIITLLHQKAYRELKQRLRRDIQQRRLPNF